MLRRSKSLVVKILNPVSWRARKERRLAQRARRLRDLGRHRASYLRRLTDMTTPSPIIEGLSGRREFLLTADGRDPYVESRSYPFPDAAKIETVLRARRNMTDWGEQYGTARTANNLAAVHICDGDIKAALTALQEAEGKLIDMLHEGNPHPEPLTFGGLAMVKYNAAVVFLTAAGDDAGDREFAEENRLGAHEALMQVGDNGYENVEFVRAAVLALPSLM